MRASHRKSYRNWLLFAQADEALKSIIKNLERVTVPKRMHLETSNKPIEYLYFLESGIASIVARSKGGSQIEVGIIGREGVTGISVLHGADRSPYDTYMQIGGEALRIKAHLIETLFARQAAARRLLLGFAQVFLLQISEAVAANAKAALPERLARWLLMVRDRTDDNELPLTHELLSFMMAARRPGVTEALQDLTRQGLIAGHRGRIVIVDRSGLELLAQDCYGLPETEYRRLIAK